MIDKIVILAVGISLIFHGLAFTDTDLEVTGIVYSDRSMAIVNGELVKEGDSIAGAKVLKVGDNYVEFERGNTHIIEYVGGKGVKRAEEKPKPERQPEKRKSYYEELLDKRDKAKDELKNVEQRNIEAQKTIRGKR